MSLARSSSPTAPRRVSTGATQPARRPRDYVMRYGRSQAGKKEQAMRRDTRPLAHFGVPLLFLLALTIVVLILRGSFSGGSPSQANPSSGKKSTTTAVATTLPTMKVKTYTVQSG